jgi:multidrug resistance efflux pump
MRGRRPVGPELAERLDGSAQARRRMRVILETLAGTMRVIEACEELGICPQRFEALRAEAIGAGVAALEPRPLGRPTRREREPEVVQLEERVAELEAELKVARVRAELAGRLPNRRRGVAKKSRPRSSRVKESSRL